MKICSRCETVNTPDATMCGNCKAPLYAVSAGPSTSEAATGPWNDSDTPTPSPSDALLYVGDSDEPATSTGEADQLAVLLGKRRPATIALVGMSSVGKTFFFLRLQVLAIRYGYKLCAVHSNGEHEELERGRIGATTTFHVYALVGSGRRRKEEIWIVDMPGEVFRGALSGRFRSTAATMRNFWLVLGAADVFAMLVPADEALGLNQDGNPLIDLSHGLAHMSAALNVIQKTVRACGDLGAAVQQLADLSATNLAERLREERDLCDKPLLVLLSKADEALQDLAARGLEDADEDPAKLVHLQAPELLTQLLGWFRTFKVDFVTACDGLPQGEKQFKEGRAAYGVWESVVWGRDMAQRSRHPLLAPFRNTAIAFAMRRRLDRDFRSGDGLH